jgi:hypothetical protein
MLLNHQHRFLFIHVPKAAGTTISRALAPLTTFRDIELGGTRYGEAIQERFAARFDLRKHSTAAAIRAKCPGHVWRRFFVFAFVRNPYARAYSIYRFLQRWKEGPHHVSVLNQSFEEFLHSRAVADGDIEIAKPQVYWLQDGEEPLPGIDFVGRVENFAKDFGFVLSMIHRRPTEWDGARHDNASAKDGEWRKAMTPDAQTRIESLYHADFEAWGYHRLEGSRSAA